MTTATDTTKPLELEDGTPVEFAYTDADGDIWVLIEGKQRLFRSDGTHIRRVYPNLRNRKDPTVASNEQPTSQPVSEIPPELVERMVRLVREMAADKEGRDINYVTADEIAALLPKPVDPDLIAAREMIAETQHNWPDSPWHVEEVRALKAGERDHTLVTMAALAGIKLGRSLSAKATS